jgi:hypothetical protein
MANCEMLMQTNLDSRESVSSRFSSVGVSLNLDLGIATKHAVIEQDPALGLESVLPPQEASYFVYLTTLFSCTKSQDYCEAHERTFPGIF